MNRRQVEKYMGWRRDEQSTLQVAVSKHRVKEAILKDLEFESKMDAEEYTLYCKWLEVKKNKDATNYKALIEDKQFAERIVSDTLFRDSVAWYLSGFYSPSFRTWAKKHKRSEKALQKGRGLSPKKSFGASKALKSYKKIEEVLSRIWNPNLLDESAIEGLYDEIEGEILPELHPEVKLCNSDKLLMQYWGVVRTFMHKRKNARNIGRNLYFLVRDRETHRLLGAFALSSDFNDLKGRDEHIGWSRETRSEKAPYPMTNHTAIGSTIMPTQPFGFYYTGGKLIALMAISDVAEAEWNRAYDKKDSPGKLVGVTTTSLYGAKTKNKGTQYSHLEPYWDELDESAGETSYEPTPDTLKLVKDYLRQEYPREYWQWYKAQNENNMPMLTNHKQRSLTWLYEELGIDKSVFTTNHKRGIYFCSLFENTNEFLRREITDKKALIRRKDFQNDVESLTKYWRETHALKRIGNLLKQGITERSPQTFYHDMISMTWEEAKKKYLKPPQKFRAK